MRSRRRGRASCPLSPQRRSARNFYICVSDVAFCCAAMGRQRPSGIRWFEPKVAVTVMILCEHCDRRTATGLGLHFWNLRLVLYSQVAIELSSSRRVYHKDAVHRVLNPPCCFDGSLVVIVLSAVRVTCSWPSILPLSFVAKMLDGRSTRSSV